jgi:hypothetical protein
LPSAGVAFDPPDSLWHRIKNTGAPNLTAMETETPSCYVSVSMGRTLGTETSTWGSDEMLNLLAKRIYLT